MPRIRIRNGVLPGHTRCSKDLVGHRLPSEIRKEVGVVNEAEALILGMPSLVQYPPEITVQPLPAIQATGQPAAFSVGASGTNPLSYQWYKNGSLIPGATASSYTTPNTVVGDHGATFYVRITNAAGVIQSATVSLSLTPAITGQPQSQSAVDGTTKTLSVTAVGPGTLGYQWYLGGSIVPGATGSSYTTPALVYGNTYSYHVVVNNSVGSATSSTAAITVTAAPPNILAHPQNAMVDEHAMATFSVTAAGTDLSYSWKRDGVPLGGTNSPTYSRQAELSEVGIPFAVAVTGPGGTANSLSAQMDILTHDSFYHQTATPAGAVPGFWLDLGRSYRWQCHRINVHTLTDPNNVRTYGLTVAALDADNVVTAYVVLGSSRLSVYSMTTTNDSVRSDDMTADNIIVPAHGRLIVYCDTGNYRLLGNTTIGSGISPMTAKVYNARPSSIYIGAVLPPFDAGYPASAKWNV